MLPIRAPRVQRQRIKVWQENPRSHSGDVKIDHEDLARVDKIVHRVIAKN